jgi:hypothetical protein
VFGGGIVMNYIVLLGLIVAASVEVSANDEPNSYATSNVTEEEVYKPIFTCEVTGEMAPLTPCGRTPYRFNM